MKAKEFVLRKKTPYYNKGKGVFMIAELIASFIFFLIKVIFYATLIPLCVILTFYILSTIIVLIDWDLNSSETKNPKSLLRDHKRNDRFFIWF